MDVKRRHLIALVLAVKICWGYGQESPRLVEQPSDIVVARYQPATLQCSAEGEPPPVITWFKDGVALIPTVRRVILPAGGLFFLRTSHARRDSDSGVYWCEATNQYGTARSRKANFQVGILRDEFRLEPADTRSAAGDTALLECSPPRGTPEPTVAWKKNGQLLELEGNDRMSIVDGGNLVIQDLRTSDDARYQCVAKNVVGVRESSVARLKVHIKPFLISGPEDTTVLTGTTVTFECRVGGDPLPDVLWRRTADNGNMPLGRVRIQDDRSLQLESVTLNDEGEYICEADNPVGTISARGRLTVHALPVLQVKPTTQTVEEGDDVKFECHARGTPKPKLHWLIEGNMSLILPGTSKGRYSASRSKSGDSILTIKNVTKNDSNLSVICFAVNLAGSALGKAKLLVTSESERPPPIIIIGPSNQTLPHRSVAVLSCNAEGKPEPIISWYHDSNPVKQSERTQVNEGGTLTIKELDEHDSGLYTCVASSKAGKSVWSATLMVETSPPLNSIYIGAADISVLPGPPSRPAVTNTTESSVTLTWTKNNKIGSSTLLGYQVEMLGGKYDSWTVVARHLEQSVYTQTGLSANTRYLFLVRAENFHGFSPPSAVSEPVYLGDETDEFSFKRHGELSLIVEARASLQREEVVKLTEAIPVDSTSIKLVWKTLNPIYLEGYYIYFRPQSNANPLNNEYKVISVLHSGDTSAFEINDLMKYTEYEFFLLPFYKDIEGRPSNLRIAKTLEDAPDAAPTNLDASRINSTSVYVMWDPPPSGTHNGVILYYRVVVKEQAEGFPVVYNATVSLLDVVPLGAVVAGLRPMSTYLLQLAAATSAGEGPYTPEASLILQLHADSSSKLLNPPNRNGLNHDLHSAVSSELLTETWFLALLGMMLTVMMMLFAAMFIVRRRHLLIKENALPSLYDSRSTSKNLVSIKAAMGLPNPIANGCKQGGNIKTDSLLWVKSRPDTWQTSEKDSYGMPEYSQVNPPQNQLPEYDKINNQNMPDYAEVEAAMITFRKTDYDDNDTSPAAYASVTLVPSPGNNADPPEWTNYYAKDNTTKKNNCHDEDLYPASNGGYFNRNVFNDSYFSNPSNSNISKFTNVSRPNDKSNLSLHSENGMSGSKSAHTTSVKDHTFSLPQNRIGTVRRHQKLRLAKFEPADCGNSVGNNVSVANDTYHGMRMQENPTFGLTKKGECSQEDGENFAIKPMKLIQHHYSRPTNLRTSPLDQNNSPVFTSFKTRYKEPEYHASTRSEPGHEA